MKEFTKQDLKDGMVLTYRNGETRVLFDKKLYGTMKEGKLLYHGKTVGEYSVDLKDQSNIGNDMDIAKVEYMGETLWERKEYVTFDEARKSGKEFKYHKWDCNGELPWVMYKMNEYSPLTINRMLDEKLWEIEQ